MNRSGYNSIFKSDEQTIRFTYISPNPFKWFFSLIDFLNNLMFSISKRHASLFRSRSVLLYRSNDHAANFSLALVQ
jgi:hypothetical protein